MLLSETFDIRFRGDTAALRVVRNNGYCWGEVETRRGEHFAISVRKDWYDYPDEEVAAAFERAGRNRKCVEASLLDLWG